MKKKIFLAVILILLFSSLASYAQEAKNLSKEEVVKLALEKNLEIAKLEKEVKIAKAKLKEAKGGFYPTVDVGTTYTRLEEAPTTSVYLIDPTDGTHIIDPQTGKPATEEIEVGTENNYGFNLSLQQPIFLGGKLWSGYNQMKNNLKSAQLELKQKKREVIYQTLEQYYNVLKAEKMVEVAKQRVKQAEHFVNVAEANKEVGVFTKTDVLQAKVNQTRANQGLLQAENGLKVAKLALKNSLGLNDGAKLKLKEELNKDKVEVMESDRAYDYALEHRIQLKLLEIQEDNLKLGLKQAENDKLYPNINLMADYKTQSGKLEDISVTDGEWQVMLSLKYNLFSGGRKSAKIDQLKGQVNKFNDSKKQVKDGIELEVKQTLLSVTEAEQRIELTKLNLEKAKENLEQTEIKYQEGIVTTSDILEAQTTLQQVKTDYYQAIYDYNLAAAKLDKVLGRPIVDREGQK